MIIHGYIYYAISTFEVSALEHLKIKIIKTIFVF